MRKFGILVIVIGAAAMAGLYLHQRGEVLSEQGEASGGEASAGVMYQCPMHPQIVSKKPGDCPICHMRLEKVEQAAGSGQQAAGSTVPAATSNVPGHAAFELSEAKQQLIGVKTIKAQNRELIQTISGAGRIRDSLGRVSAEVFEFEAGRIRAGQKGEVLLGDFPGQVFKARVESVGFGVDPATRTIAVLLRLEKSEKRPAAGSLAEVRIKAGLGRGLVIPQDAVLDTGDHKIAFVRRGVGIFEPRSLKLGREDDSGVEVLKGLAEGDEVVTGANFLVDSESRFRAAGEEYGKHAH